MAVKYPEVKVQLSGQDGNVFSVIGRVYSAIARQVGRQQAEEFELQARASGSYDSVLRLVMDTVEVE